MESTCLDELVSGNSKKVVIFRSMHRCSLKLLRKETGFSLCRWPLSLLEFLSVIWTAESRKKFHWLVLPFSYFHVVQHVFVAKFAKYDNNFANPHFKRTYSSCSRWTDFLPNRCCSRNFGYLCVVIFNYNLPSGEE